jgi:Tol biopolymer transport system component
VSTLILLDLVAVMAPSQAKVPGPNGQIVFGRFDPAIGDDDIYVTNPDGTHNRLVIPGPHERPVWSPDGKRIAVTAQAPDGRATTAIVNADGSGYVLEPLPDSTLNLACGPWSPDGSRLACLGFDHTTAGRREGVFTVRASDWGDLQRVTSNPCLGENCEDDPGDFSPNGTQIVFERQDPLQANGTRPSSWSISMARVSGESLRGA